MPFIEVSESVTMAELSDILRRIVEEIETLRDAIRPVQAPLALDDRGQDPTEVS